ncbi:phage tail protein [Paenibacillus sp. GM2]|uniref:phage tail protein n=1 Tax=Paenibacillus sp. GM2 TaxID=1622070 RepID=UPI000838D597|nr:hypothetical protein [Paenibacillus sp. GM2]
MSDEVGKVSLGLELVGGGDLNKQITMAAGTIGEQLTKSLQSTFKGFSLKTFATNISQTLKTTTETAMKGITDGMESTVTAVEGRLIKTISVADQAMRKSIEDNKTAAEAAIDSVGAKLGGLKAPSFFSKLAIPNLQPAATAAATPAMPAPRTVVKAKAPEIDTSAAKAEIESLTAVLDNVNAKIEIQERKLADLKQAYNETFNDAGKAKLQEKIVNTEATLLRLTNTSDKTARKIWELEDSLKNAGQAAIQVEKPVGNLGQKMIQTNKPLKAAKGNLDQAAKSAVKASSSFGAAARSSTHMGNSFTKAISRILKQVFVFAIIYKAIRGFQDYMGGALKTNAQFAASLNAIQTNLRVAFQPIYEAILPAINALMSALAKITAYIAAFISALFGKTYQQSYQAAKGIETAKKAMEGYGKSSKKAGKEAKGALAGFDELNTLDFSKADTGVDDGGGGGAGGFEMQQPDMDITGIQAKMDELAAGVKSTFDKAWSGVKQGWEWTVKTFGPSFQAAWAEISPTLDRWKEQFKTMFEDVKTLGAPLGEWFKTGLVKNIQDGVELAGHVWAGLSDSAQKVVASLWEAAFPILDKFVTEGLPRISEFVTGAQEIFRKLFDLVKQIFDDIWRDAVDPALKLVSQIIQDTMDMVYKWWDNWGKKIVDKLKEALDGIKKLWSNLWDNYLKPVTQSALKFLTDLWDKHLKGLVEEVMNFVGKLIDAALDIFNKFILPIANWLVKTLGPVFAEVFDVILKWLGNLIGGIIDAAKNIIKALGGIVDFIAGAFTGDWKRAWEGIKTFFQGIADAIGSIFKGVINGIIEALNWMIRQLNKIKIDIPEWVQKLTGAGATFGFNIAEIPKLAKGGLAYGPTLAMVGDNKGAAADPEVISPLSQLQDMISSGYQPMIELLVMIADILRNIEAKEWRSTIGDLEFGRYVGRAIGKAEQQLGYALFDR